MFGAAPKRKSAGDHSSQLAPSRHRRASAPRAVGGECTSCDYAAWILAVLGTVFVLVCHLLPGVIAGLLVYELVHVLFPVFARRLPDKRAKFAAVALMRSQGVTKAFWEKAEE